MSSDPVTISIALRNLNISEVILNTHLFYDHCQR